MTFTNKDNTIKFVSTTKKWAIKWIESGSNKVEKVDIIDITSTVFMKIYFWFKIVEFKNII